MIRLLTIALIIVIYISISVGNIIKVPQDKPTIQAGIDSAFTGDTVLVSENTYYENINFKGKAVTVASEFIMDDDTSHISKTIIDGSQASDPDSGSVVYFISGEDTTSNLYGFTITGGKGSKFSPAPGRWRTAGAGIYIEESSAKIFNNIIRNNSITDNSNGGMGAGIFIWVQQTENLWCIIENNVIEQNTVTGDWTGGAGIYIGTFPGVELTNFIINKNIIKHNIVNNTSDWKAMGGGIRCELALPCMGLQIISNNNISNNEVRCIKSFGGGIYLIYIIPNGVTQDPEPNPLICNNIITDNYSDWKGGAISIWTTNLNHTPASENFNMYPQPAIINNTIVNNIASKGCGVYCWNSIFLIMNTILWNNLSLTGSNEIDTGLTGNSSWDQYANDNNVIYVHNSDIQGGWEGEGNIAQNPVFKFPAHGEYDLDKYSPCISTGVSSVLIEDKLYEAPEEDFYGRDRPLEDVDMGALESTFDKDMNELVLYLSFDDSTAVDASGYENHGILIGEPRDTTGILENAFYFDGNSKIRIPDSESLDTDTSMTIALWIRPDSVTAEGAKFMSKWYSSPQQGDWLFSLSSRDTLYEGDTLVQWGAYAANYGQFGGYGGIGVPRDSIHRYLKLHQWQHMAITFDRGYMCSYVNGQFVDDTMSIVEYTSLNEYNTDDIYIGGFWRYYEGYKFFGSLDEVRIYDRALTAAEVKSLVDYVTAIEEKSKPEKVPHEYTLFQNYPNPFNPSTVISWQLAVGSNVELSIYDILGQKIETLLNKPMPAGYHEIQFNGQNLSSGVYLYRIKAGEWSDVKKMILLR